MAVFFPLIIYVVVRAVVLFLKRRGVAENPTSRRAASLAICPGSPGGGVPAVLRQSRTIDPHAEYLL